MVKLRRVAEARRRRAAGCARTPSGTWRPTSCSATGPTSAPTRCFISSAALLVKVMARISNGETPRSSIRWAMRWVSTRVLPEPAPATTSSGPSPWVTAASLDGVQSVAGALRARRERSSAGSGTGSGYRCPGTGSAVTPAHGLPRPARTDRGRSSRQTCEVSSAEPSSRGARRGGRRRRSPSGRRDRHRGRAPNARRRRVEGLDRRPWRSAAGCCCC